MRTKMKRVIKVDDRIYYIPAKSLIVEIEGDMGTVDIDSWLLKQTEGFHEFKNEQSTNIKDNQKVSTDLTILAGTKCNLHCVYCYSEAGDIPEIEVDLSKVKKAIQHVLENAKIRTALSKSNSRATIKFTGGGEPTCNWNIICQSIDYIKNISMRDRCHLTLQTNGQLTSDMSDYIIANFDEVIVSCDGFSKIQNLLRPRADGEKSWPMVDRFLHKLNCNKIDFFLRATVTNDSIAYMEQICEYFFSKYENMKYLHFEPLGPGGRGKRYATVDLNHFYSNLIKCEEKYQNKVGTSMSIYSHKYGYCCDSQSGRSLVLAPTGKFVSCVEESITDLSGDCSWVISEIDRNTLVFNKAFTSQSHEGNECKNCLAYNFCHGGCPQRIVRDGDNISISPYGKELCKCHKKMIKHQMMKLISEQLPITKTNYDTKEPYIVKYCCI